jgi:hypothetical protein
MARRKSELADKLGGSSSPRPGWRDTIIANAPQPEPEPTVEEPVPSRRARAANRKPRRKTYLLAPSLIDRIDDLAEQERVGISELVSFLLTTSLEMIEAGELAIPTRPARRRIINE